MNATDTQNYIQVLEKTNQQLSLWYNPFSLSVTFLTIFIALLALFFSYVLWRQGRDYKDFLSELKRNVERQTKIYAKSVLDEHIKSQQEKQDTLTGDARRKIDSEIQALQKARESLNGPTARTFPAIPSLHQPGIGPSRLTEAQIASILALLESFGATSDTIQSVESALRGGGYD